MKEIPYNLYKLFFKAFSNETRFKIIQLLRKEPRNVKQICKELKFEQSRVSHSLNCLEACGFVNARREGKNNVYSLDKKHIIPILKEIDEHIKRYSKWLEACGVLKNEPCKLVR